MSTAKLREALWDMEHYGASPAPDLAQAARAELEAIEKAARTLEEWDASGNRPHPDFASAWATISTIAKKAK